MNNNQSKPNLRNIQGLLLLDKPIAMTSNTALQIVKRLYMAKKAGHTGSLDPLASGMLPICFGEATKFAQFLLDTDKWYQVTAKLGIKTTTGDAEGEVVAEKPIPNFTEKEIEKILEKFRGEIMQLPSMYSALKHKGQPLYKLARAGVTIEREKRPVTIFELNLLRKTDTELEFNVHCSKGTYIRTLIEDIGDELDVGAHVTTLRRLRVGEYKEEQMVSLPTIENFASQQDFNKLNGFLLPIETMVIKWPLLQVTDQIAYYMRQGNSVIVPQAPSSGWVRLQLKNGIFIGVAEVLPDGKIAPRRLVN